MGIISEIERPKPSNATTFVGLLVSNLIFFKPKSLNICAPVPYSRKSGLEPNASSASTVSRPAS